MIDKLSRQFAQLFAFCAPLFLSLFTQLVTAEELSSNSPQSCAKRPLTIEELRALALASSPLVGEIDIEFSAELSRAVEIESLQNPELQAEQTFTRMTIDGANDAQAQVSIAQPLRLSNFGSRSRFAELIRRSGEQKKSAKLFGLMQQLSLQFRILEGYNQSLAAVKEARILAMGKVSLIRDGSKKGLFSVGDERLFEGERYRLLARERGILSRIALLESELARSIGVSCRVEIEAGNYSREVPSLEELVEKATNSPLSEQARVDALKDLTMEQLKLAELDRTPQITPRLMYQHTNDGGDFVGLGLSVPLPIWNQNRGETIRAAAESKVAQLQRTFVKEGALKEQIRQLRIATVNAEEQVKLFESRVIPAFADALKFEDKRYSEGKGNLLQVWQTLRAVSDVRAERFELFIAAATIRAELSTLVGEEF